MVNILAPVANVKDLVSELRAVIGGDVLGQVAGASELLEDIDDAEATDGRELMRHVRHYNNQAKPFKWTYRKTASRITSGVQLHMTQCTS